MFGINGGEVLYLRFNFMKKILITGAAGFIGYHLAKNLLNTYPDEVSLVLIDNLQRGQMDNDFKKLLDGLAGLNLAPEYSGLEWVAKEPATVNDPSTRIQLDELYAALDESDDVQNYFTSEA